MCVYERGGSVCVCVYEKEREKGGRGRERERLRGEKNGGGEVAESWHLQMLSKQFIVITDILSLSLSLLSLLF